MQTVTFKLQEEILKDIDKVIVPLRFNNRTEFIREAVREKLNKMENEAFLQNLAKFKGISKRRVTQMELRKAREEAYKELTSKVR